VMGFVRGEATSRDHIISNNYVQQMEIFFKEIAQNFG
jgi:hypothetical protein